MNRLQKKRPDSVKARISAKLKNRTLPDHVKQKISATMKKRWAELDNNPEDESNYDDSIVL